MKVRNDQESNESIPQVKITIELDQASHTPLMIASGEGKFQTVMELVQSGADVNAMSLLNSTAVQFAAQQGHYKIVQFLAEYGADLNHKNLLGWNAFVYAAGGNNLNLVQWLIEEKEISINADDVNTALLSAAISKNLKILHFIFKNFGEMAGDNKKIRSMGKNPYVNIRQPSNDLNLNYARDLVLLEHNELEQLDLNVQSNIAKLMMERLPKATSLKKLIYRHQNDPENLVQFLITSSLVELKFISDSVTPVNADLLVQVVYGLLKNKNSKLKILDLGHCKIGLEGAKALAIFVEQSETLECLNLAHCELGDEAIKLIVESINRNPKTLHALDLTYNQISIEGSQILANFLQTPVCSLQSLNISANSSTEDGIILIADAMKINKTVSILNLSNTYPKNNECAVAIADMIAANKTLTQLNLRSNNFTDDQGMMIINALKENTSIVNIDLGSFYGGNSFSKKSAMSLGETLKYNNILKEIRLDQHENLGSEAKYLASGLSQNNTLVKLDLACTCISSDGSGHLLEILRYYNCTLQYLSIYPEKNQEIDSLLRRNTKLASDELNVFELKNIMDEIRKARWKSERALSNKPYSLRFMLSFYSNQISNQSIREAVNNAIQHKDKQELINSFLRH